MTLLTMTAYTAFDLALCQVALGLAIGLVLNLALWFAAAVFTLDVIDERLPGGELRRAVLWLRDRMY